MVDMASGLLGVVNGYLAENPAPFAAWLDDSGNLLHRELRTPSDPEFHDERYASPRGFTGMLDAFVRIRTGRDVVGFANRYGVLHLCAAHDLPKSHNARRWSRLTDVCESKREAEPIAVWLQFAEEARAILRVAAAIQAGHDAAIGDLQRIWPAGAELIPLQAFAENGLTGGHDALFLTAAAERWVDLGGVRPHLVFRDGHPFLALDGSDMGTVSIFGALAMQMLTAVTRSHGVVACSGCGEVYVRTNRKAQQGRRNYCPTCREDGVPGRQRQRARRERLARATSMDC